MAQLINPTNDARQSFTTVVGTQRIRVNLAYLEGIVANLVASWFIDLILLTDVETPIVQGWKLSTSVEVGYKLGSLLEGAIVPIPITAPSQDLVSIDAWGITHQLVYFTEQDLNVTTLPSTSQGASG